MARDKTKVVVYLDAGRRARVVGEALGAGCVRHGCQVDYKVVDAYRKTVDGDIAIFYGFRESLREVFKTYRVNNKTTIFADLGYWGRLAGGRIAGYHKLVVNGTQPTEYFQKYKHDSKRFESLGVDVKPTQIGGQNVLLAGMSGKAAGVFGYKPQVYEQKLLYVLKKATKRTIVYRPKPSWKGATPLPGALYSNALPLEQEFKNTFIVSTHHSNVSVDALVHGIPCNVNAPCVAQPLSTPIHEIENPHFPSDAERHSWLCDVSYVQWNVKEMETGKVWQHFKNEELIL